MIRLEKLRKEFDELVAVNDLEVVIPEGEIYGLIGPNGAGKTTTIRMACGLLEPTAGQVFISDVNVHEEPERAQQFIGYLSDFFSVYEDLKVWEYLDYFAHAYKLPEAGLSGRIDEVIQQVNLEVKRDAMIKGLSRGMKQRLGIARAIIHRPKVLLLDEPASGLDPKARLDLRNLLRALGEQGTTILISSHILTELEGFCTSIGLMERGVMVRSGTI
jgi:ABC-2 type transport system ATP-binding protein